MPDTETNTKHVQVLYRSSIPPGTDVWYISGSVCSPLYHFQGPRYEGLGVAAIVEKFIKMHNLWLSVNMRGIVERNTERGSTHAR